MTSRKTRFEIRVVHVPVLTAEKLQIDKAADTYPICEKIANQQEECLLVISLDASYHVFNSRVISIAAPHRGLSWMATVFRGAVADGADAIIVVHNHPGSNAFPSGQDNRFYNRLGKACEIMEIELADFLVVSGEQLYSLNSGKMVK